MDEDEIRDLIAEAMSSVTRDKAKASDYGDPEGKKFPIMTAASVLSAARLLGRAKGYDEAKKAAVKARIIRIAKRKGFALPKSWSDKKEAFVMSDQMRADAVQAALAEDSDPDMDGDDDTSYDSFERGYVRHIFPDNTVIFQMGWEGDWFKRPFTIDDNGEATLGEPCERVVPQLTFASVGAEASVESITEGVTIQPGTIFELFEQPRFEASDDGDDGFHLVGTAIMPGINRSGNRIYPKETLASAVELFKGKKMYIDHPTSKDQRENGGVRSFRDAGAVIQEAWTNTSGGIDYKAVVIDPPTREKLALMKRAGALDAMGVSVNYQGVGTPTTYEGRTVDTIESIDELNSLDFVTEPGAWGSISRLESVAEPPPKERVFAVDEETRKLIESLKARLDESDKKLEASDKAREASEKNARIANTKVTVKQALEKSGLPQISQDRVLASYEGVESADDLDATIESEKKFIESLKEELSKPTGKRGPVTPLKRRNGVVVGMGNTGSATNVGTTESATEQEEEWSASDEDDIDRGVRALEGFIPNPKSFLERMG
jgi:hypothetical protein